MTRSIRDFKIDEKKDEINTFILQWLRDRDFYILDTSSTGKTFELSRNWARMRIQTISGAIIALSYNMFGAVAFEVKITQRDDGCLIHGEFFAVGGSIFCGKEYSLNEKSGFIGMFPIQRGYALMNQFIEDIGHKYNLSGLKS